jgi:16S rRNA (cytosine967-C5)-methyltransferase
MKWMVTEQSVQEVSEKQRSILESAAQLVKPRGQLLYATCTMLRQENEDVVEEFTSRHPDFTIVDIRTLIHQWQHREVTTGSFFKLLPHQHGTDGFFCVVLNKQADR